MAPGGELCAIVGLSWYDRRLGDDFLVFEEPDNVQVDKKSVMEALLMEAESVFVHLDPTRDMVLVPPHLKKGPLLILEIGLNMRVPIPDLEVLDEGINATLSFGGKPYPCWIPWHSVFALVTPDKKGMMWQEDMPEKVAENYLPPEALRAHRMQEKKTHLHLVTEEDSDQHEDEAQASTNESVSTADSQPDKLEYDKECTLAHVRPEPVEPPVLYEVLAGDKSAVEEAIGQDDAVGSEASEESSAAGEVEEQDAPSSDPEPPAGKRTLPPYLRVVK